MKIIYIGGYTNTSDSHFIHYKDFVQKYIAENKKVIIIALSLEPGYFTPRLKELYKQTPIILDSNSSKKIEWNDMDLIYILGGSTKNLNKGLIEYNFSLDKLKEDVVLIADSAGANILSKYYIGQDTNNNCKVEEGLNKESNIFMVCHIDNPTKTPEEKIQYAKDKATELNSNLLLLKENEQRLFINTVQYEKTEREDIFNYLQL